MLHSGYVSFAVCAIGGIVMGAGGPKWVAGALLVIGVLLGAFPRRRDESDNA